MERLAGGKPAARLHVERRDRRPQPRFQPSNIAAQDRREVGIDHGRIPPRDQLDQRGNAVADRNLPEPHLPRDTGERGLVRRKLPAVHQHDRNGAQPAVERGLQHGAGLIFVQRSQHRAIGHDPLVDFRDLREQGCRQVDPAREDVGPFLRADAQGIAEPARDRQQRRFPLAFEQGVGGDGRAQAQFGAGQGKPWARSGEPAHRLHGRIVIAAGVFGQEFRAMQRAIGRNRHDIGEGAAAIDPESPGVFSHAPALAA